VTAQTHISRCLEVPSTYRLCQSLSHAGRGVRDPCLVVRGHEACWGLQGPSGPLAVSARQHDEHLSIDLFGVDADWLEPRLANMFGLTDQPTDFCPTPPHLRALAKKYAGLHLLRAPLLLTRLVQVVLLQLITFHEATRAWRRLIEFAGHTAPTITQLRCPPNARQLAEIPVARYVSFGISQKQARTVVEVARAHHFVERLVNTSTAEFVRSLQQIPGVGPWTANYVAGTAGGHADAQLLGDFHLPNTIAWMLAGEARADDPRMLELLQPYSPHRFRIVRWSWAEGGHAPRRGPRASYGGRTLRTK
jgi:3-methyladenine DNA glycosylase/8-oxoguanine DNA glycosylase